ncbi:MAG: hypothetical protein EOO65_02730 [Methanosarcinales archaeon]|nr:MAG: hypothetical protein EOO65_02730 [Methanosarcinales archaeon]
MYLAVSPSDSYYASTRDGITVFLLILIPLSVAYYVAALLVDLSLQFTSRREKEAKARMKARGSRTDRQTKQGVDILRDEVSVEKTSDTGVNPMFLTDKGIVDRGDVVQALKQQVRPPEQVVWLVYRSQYINTMKALKEKSAEFAELRKMSQRLRF